VICVINGDWRITAINRRAVELAGRVRADLLGAAIWDYPVLAPNPALWGELQRAMVRRTPFVRQLDVATLGVPLRLHVMPHRDGLLLQALEQESPHPFDEPHSTILRIARGAESRARTLQSLTAALSGALAEEEVSAVVLRQALPAFGATAGDVVLLSEDRQEFRALCWVGYPEELVREWMHYPVESGTPGRDIVRTGEPLFLTSITVIEERYPRLAAMLRANSLSAYAGMPIVLGGRVSGVVSFNFPEAREFTEEDRAMLLAFAAQCALALERAQLFNAEQRARAEAEAANQAKTDFLAVMSHELRTPLTAILGYEELLADGVSGPVNDAQQLQLERIKVSAMHLLQLIDELLTFSRLETDDEHCESTPIALATILDESVALIAPLAAARRLTLAATPPVLPRTLFTDPAKLRQVLVNLLSNAVKFTERGRIDLTASCDDHTVRIDVRDTGIGIAEEHLDRIFEPFWQAERRTTRRAGGTGLGLSVSRGLVNLLGGTLTVESEVGVGSVFTILLPA
jgi:signal transduction histidine kinase